MLDLIEYFDTFFAGVTAELRTEYWREAIELAPRLSGHDRARLWSVLWYDFQPFTDLYLTLYEGLQKLAFAPEALLGMDALIPREKSIVDVLTLDQLGADAADTLLVRPKQADGRAEADAELPRSLICALTAERQRRHRREAVGLLRPYRPARLPGRPLAAQARQPRATSPRPRAWPKAPIRCASCAARQGRLSLPALLGRARASAILLCIPDGNQEVRDLSDMMTAWIDQTIGATPADRAKQKNALFLVLTKMDREFEQKRARPRNRASCAGRPASTTR